MYILHIPTNIYSTLETVRLSSLSICFSFAFSVQRSNIKTEIIFSTKIRLTVVALPEIRILSRFLSPKVSLVSKFFQFEVSDWT